METTSQKIRKELLAISIEKKVSFQNIQTIFLLERMVARLTRNEELFETVIFKGGYVSLRVFNSPRYTIDLDALIKNADLIKTEVKAIEVLEKDFEDGVWFKFEKKTDLTTLGEYGGVRLWFRCGIGSMPDKYYKSQSLHLDLATGDSIYPAPLMNSMDEIIDGKVISWKIYPVESTVSEKLHTLLIRGSENSRSKDVFDLYYLLPQCDLNNLKKALVMTFSSRDSILPEKLSTALEKIDTGLLEKGWKSATAGLFDRVSIHEAFKVILDYCNKIDKLREVL